ncbi:hypothetical protein JTB14_024814 [Gonioctena quinquepunctata]|nr:hypothetical protein JTB14_024814 [Gonioctena quinquepunctata]
MASSQQELLVSQRASAGDINVIKVNQDKINAELKKCNQVLQEQQNKLSIHEETLTELESRITDHGDQNSRTNKSLKKLTEKLESINNVPSQITHGIKSAIIRGNNIITYGLMEENTFDQIENKVYNTITTIDSSTPEKYLRFNIIQMHRLGRVPRDKVRPINVHFDTSLITKYIEVKKS